MDHSTYLPAGLRVATGCAHSMPCDALVVPTSTRLKPRHGHAAAAYKRAGPTLSEQCAAALHCVALQSTAHGGRTGYTMAMEAESRAELDVSAALVAPCCPRTLPALRVISAVTPYAARLEFLGACATAVEEVVHNVLATARGAGLQSVALPMRLWEDAATLSAGRAHARRLKRERRRRRSRRRSQGFIEHPHQATGEEAFSSRDEEEEAEAGSGAGMMIHNLDVPKEEDLDRIYSTCARVAVRSLARFLVMHPGSLRLVTLCRELPSGRADGRGSGSLPSAIAHADRRAARFYDHWLRRTFQVVASGGMGVSQGADAVVGVTSSVVGLPQFAMLDPRGRQEQVSRDMRAGAAVVVDSDAAADAGRAAAAAPDECEADGPVEELRPIRIVSCPMPPMSASAEPLAQACSGSCPMVGDRCVVFPGPRTGIVAYVGAVRGRAPTDVWVGVALDEPEGDCDGRDPMPGGERLFECGSRHGVFASPEDVVVVGAAASGPAAVGEGGHAPGQMPVQRAVTRLLSAQQAAALCPAQDVIPPLVVTIERVSVVGCGSERHHEYHTRLEFSLGNSSSGGGDGKVGCALERVSVRVPRRYREFEALRDALVSREASGSQDAKKGFKKASKAVRAEGDLASQQQVKALPFPQATGWLSVKQKVGGAVGSLAMGLGSALAFSDSASQLGGGKEGERQRQPRQRSSGTGAGTAPAPTQRHLRCGAYYESTLSHATDWSGEPIAHSNSEARRLAERWEGLEAWLQTLVALRADDPVSHARRAALQLPPRAGTGDRAARGAILKCLLGFFGVSTACEDAAAQRQAAAPKATVAATPAPKAARLPAAAATAHFPSPATLSVVAGATKARPSKRHDCLRGSPALANITNTKGARQHGANGRKSWEQVLLE